MNQKASKIVFSILGLLLGIGIGLLIIRDIDLLEVSLPLFFLVYAAEGLMALVCYLVSLIAHEGGHLVFGLASGYRFSSFRVGSFMISEENGHLVTSRYSLAGTGGQCIMDPPDMKDGEIPYILYNMGGVMMNLICASICLLIGLAVLQVPYVSTFFLMMVVINIYMALTNGIPAKAGLVANDGFNTVAISRSKAARRAFWIMMKGSVLAGRGISVTQMDEEWFQLPDEKDMNNEITSYLGVLRENRFMAAHQFDEALALAEKLLKYPAVLPIYQKGLICDIIYCRILNGNNDISELKDRETAAYLKQMKDNPSVIRTSYAVSLMVENDQSKADECLKQLEKVALTYPIKSDIDAERELIRILAEKKTNNL